MSYHGVFAKEGMKRPETQKNLINLEEQLVDKLNKQSEDTETKKTILDDSLNDILVNYSKRMSSVIEDITSAMTKENIVEEAKTMGWIGVTIRTIGLILDVMTRPENIIYCGLSLVFISIFMYYVFVSS
jgi:rRNA pseudouridine-1189 N-methylase Emg1 (Nep1/Mra1 family)